MNFRSTLQMHCGRAVPLVAVDGAIDQIATVRDVIGALREGGDTGHDMLYIWTASRGLEVAGSSRAHKAANDALSEAKKRSEIGNFTFQPTVAFKAIEYMVNKVVSDQTDFRIGVVFFTGDRILDKESQDVLSTVQWLMDLRDLLKSNQSALYFVGTDFSLPKELTEHFVTIKSDLPTDDDYKKILSGCYDQLKKSVPDLKFDYLSQEDEMAGTLRGMSPFAAEQTAYLAADKTGIHIDRLRDRAIQTLNGTRGLTVYKGTGQGFSVIGGLSSLKKYANQLINGRLKIKLVVYCDEIEKALAGSTGGDSSGVSQNMLGTLLTEIQESKSLGMLLTGVYGTGKSEFAKRFSEEAGAVCVHLDLAGMKDSLVGNSESNLRRALATIRSIGGEEGGIVYLATSNRISHLPPELKRRFNLGTYFFYFPDKDESKVIWNIYTKQYEIKGKVPADLMNMQWTGAEIESCCRLAYLMNTDLASAAQRIVPVAQTARHEIEKLCEEAEGRFLSTSYDGPFKREHVTAKTERGVRF